MARAGAGKISLSRFFLRRQAATVLLLLLLLALQYPLWFGKRGWFKVWEMRRQLQELHVQQNQLIQRNMVLSAEANDLKASQEGIEERARFEQGLTRPNEIFYSWGAPPKSKP